MQTIDHTDGIPDLAGMALPPPDQFTTADLALMASYHSWDRRTPCGCGHCTAHRSHTA